jgi:hypothetical protein
LAVPILLLFTGISAVIRNWVSKPVLFLMLVLNLPLSYYAGYVRPLVYGLSNQTPAHWFGNLLKSAIVPQINVPPPFQIPGLLFGYPLVLLLSWGLRKSPKRWWLYGGLALAPVMFGALIQPVWIDPMFHHYGP